MASDVVQFRQDAEALEYLRRMGLNPNEVGKLAFEAAVREIRARLPEPVERAIREVRDAR